MKTSMTVVILAGLIAVAGCSQPATQPAAAGPGGGDVVPIQGGNAYAELLANADTGEVLLQTWDNGLKTRRPIEAEPITVGSGDDNVELTPHPRDTDPPGTCSRFYGAAGWVRGGGIRSGWMHGGGAGDHQEFAWQRCWQAGRRHGSMWEEMGPHRRMGPGHGTMRDSVGEHGHMGPGHGSHGGPPEG